MFYHLIVTNKCNLNCKYCCEKAFGEPEEFPEEIDQLDDKIKYSLDELKYFIDKDPNATITFYGGEPLLNPKFIMSVIDKIPNAKYMVQTNGILLKSLPQKYINNFDTILVSIDGDECITNNYRGKDVYKKIIENIKKIKENGFKGEVVARMTIEEQNIYDSVLHLLKDCDSVFDSIHWQIDANFWFNDWRTRNFADWVDNNYIPNVKKLINFWLKEMRKGVVLKLYPFLGITNSLLFKEDLRLLKCGSGHSNYTIQTDGNIVPCPIMTGMKKYYLGNICVTNPAELKKIVILPSDCKICNNLDICGGRCLYSNILCPWPQDQKAKLCKTVDFTINELNKKIPTIKKLISQDIIYKTDFLYNKYNGAEIIP